jgi:hypothetical protein
MSSAFKRTNPPASRRAQRPAIIAPTALQPVAPQSVNGEHRAPIGAAIDWNYVVACEARNALQVVLSGGEILLDGQFGGLTAEQQSVLAKMMDNARHINSLIASLRASQGEHIAEPSTIERRTKNFVTGDGV